MINLDREGQPLRPAILWLDRRRAKGLKAVGDLWGAAFRLAGVSSTVAHLHEQAEANWIRSHQPGIWDRMHNYLFLFGYLPFASRLHRWSSCRDWKWLAVPMNPALLPQLIPPAGLPLIPAAADKVCEVIGAGGPGAAGRRVQAGVRSARRGLARERGIAPEAIVGFGDVHTRAHVYRAILEGLEFALREGAERIARRSGGALTELRGGGGSQSDAAIQLTADVVCGTCWRELCSCDRF